MTAARGGIPWLKSGEVWFCGHPYHLWWEIRLVLMVTRTRVSYLVVKSSTSGRVVGKVSGLLSPVEKFWKKRVV